MGSSPGLRLAQKRRSRIDNSSTSASCGPRNDSPGGVNPKTEPTRVSFAPFQVLVAAALFGTTGTSLSWADRDLDPWTTGALRLVLGGALLTLVAWRDLTTLQRAPRALILGSSMVASYQLLFFWSVTATGVATSTLVTIGVSPVASRVISSLRRRRRPDSTWWIRVAVLVVGLVVLVVGGSDSIDVRPLGVVAAVVAGTSFAAYTECASVSIERGVAHDATLGALFFGAGLLCIPALVIRPIDVLASGRGVLVLAHLSVVTLTLAYMAFGRALRVLPSTTVTMLTMAEPLVATTLAVVVLHEEIRPLAWCGAALLVAGLVMVTRSSEELRDAERTSPISVAS